MSGTGFGSVPSERNCCVHGLSIVTPAERRDPGSPASLCFFLQNPQQSINCVVGTIFALAPHFVVQNAVLIRLHVFAALEVEGQKNGGALAARPTNEMVVVVFLEHGVSLRWNGYCIRLPQLHRSW